MPHNNGKAVLKGVAAQLPKTKQGVAALALRVATRMAAEKTKQSIDQVLLDLSVHLDCNLEQLKYYHSHIGLPDFMVDWAINYFSKVNVRVYRHQLNPTKAVLSGYGIV